MVTLDTESSLRCPCSRWLPWGRRLLLLLGPAIVACTLSMASVQAASRDAEPIIWFAPLDSVFRPWLGYSGAVDYPDLFAVDAPWSNAASHVKVFKIYGTLLTSYSDEELARMFADLKRRHIALALEFPPLTLPRGSRCPHIEGFEKDGAGLDYARRIKRAGGALEYVAMDAPFYFATMHPGPPNCKWSTREVAENATANIKMLKTEFPDVQVGDIEPVPAMDAPGWLERYKEWFETYRAVAGSNLAFLHADVRWASRAWKEDARAVAALAKEEGIVFGMIYNAAADGPHEWLLHARQHFTDYERDGPPPEHAVFQSWHPDPRRLLPETNGRTFTNLINEYVKGRWAGAAPVQSAKAPPRSDVGGAPWQPIATLRGTVPTSATAAVAAVRINVECDCQAKSRVTVVAFRYREEGDANRRTLDFSDGFERWSVSGTALVRLELEDGREAVRISASASQSERMNSPTITVRPGASYVFEVFGRRTRESQGSGFVGLIFLANSKEISREKSPL